MTARLVLATRNAGKLRELRVIVGESLAGLPDDAVVAATDLDRLGLPDPGDVVETGVTFVENAVLKARTLAEATGLPAVADDSGLCVGVLGGSPGVFSARWAGGHGDDAANLGLLLAQLTDVPDQHRRAWFECAAVLVTPDGATEIAHGRLEGMLLRAPRGTGGFGYDPILVPDGYDRTCAELAPDEKNAISHRGRAFRALAPALVSAVTDR